MTLLITLALFVAVVGLNIFATRRVATSAYYDAEKKQAQYFLIWLFPIVGATLAYSLAREEKVTRVTTDLTEPAERGDSSIRLDSAAGNPFGDSANHE